MAKREPSFFDDVMGRYPHASELTTHLDVMAREGKIAEYSLSEEVNRDAGELVVRVIVPMHLTHVVGHASHGGQT